MDKKPQIFSLLSKDLEKVLSQQLSSYQLIICWNLSNQLSEPVIPPKQPLLKWNFYILFIMDLNSTSVFCYGISGAAFDDRDHAIMSDRLNLASLTRTSLG